MAVDVATLGIKVENGQINATSDSLARLTGESKKAEGATALLSSAYGKLGLALGGAAMFGKFVKESIDAQYATAQLEARIKSTGGAAKMSISQLEDYASALQQTTQFSDDAVKSAQAMLLTFTKIKADNFNDVTLAVANLATAMGNDLQGAAIQIGKAMQGNAGSMTALQKVGIAFTAAEKDVIEAHFAAGRAADAQRMILKELTVEFGGAAQAARQTLGGALKGLANDFGDAFEVTKSGTKSVVGVINGLGSSIKEISAVTGGLINIAEAVAAVYAGKLLASLLAYNATLVATARTNALVMASDIKRAEFAVASARAQQIAAAQTLALTTQALVVNEATAASQMAALTGLQAANMRAAASANALAVATTKSSVALTLGAQAATLFGKAIAFATSGAGAAAILIGVFMAGKYAIDKLAAATDELTEAEDRESAAKLKQLYAMNPHLKATREAAAAAAAAAKTLNDQAEARKAAVQDLVDEIAKTREKIAFNAEHKGQLIELERLKNIEKRQNDEVTASIERQRVAVVELANAKWFAANGGPAPISTAERAGKPSGAPTKNVGYAGKITYTPQAGSMEAAAKKFADWQTNYAKEQKDKQAAYAKMKAEEIAAAEIEIEKNRMRMMTDTFSTFIEGMLTKGLRSFDDFWKSILAGFTRMVANMAAAELYKKLFKKGGGAEDTGGVTLGGIGAAINAHPFIAATAMIGAAVLTAGSKMRQAAKDVEAMTKALNTSMTALKLEAGVITEKEAKIADAKDRFDAQRAAIRAKAERQIDEVDSNMGTTRWHKQKRRDEIWKEAQKEIDKVNDLEKIRLAQLEKEKDAINAVTKSSLGMVAGYKYQAAIFAAAGSRTFGGGSTGIPSMNPSTSTSGGGSGDMTIQVVMPDGSVIGNAVLKDFRGRAQRQYGDTTRWGEIQ
jgi:hypothetical protein